MLAVGIPAWPLTAAGIGLDIPAAVFSANRVVVASRAAAGYGISKGMRRREAQARCPEVEVLDHDPARDARAFEPIVSVVESFSPRVEIVKPGLCVTPSVGPSRYFGGEDRLRQQLAEAVDAVDIEAEPACVGIADGVFAATMAARRGLIVPAGASPSFLGPFAITMLASPLDEVLLRLGITTFAAFAELPRAKVVARFGVEGAMAHRIASGHDDHLFEPRSVPPELTVKRDLDPPAHRVDIAMFAGKAAADELIQRLGAMGLACARLGISATTEHDEERVRTWRYSAAFTSAAIAERVRWQLDGWLNDEVLTGGIAKLRLIPEDIGPAVGAQAKLWGKRTEVSDEVRRGIARVQGLLGPQGAKRVVLSGGRDPAQQMTLAPWGDPIEPERRGGASGRSVAGPVITETPPWPGRLPSPAPTIVHPVPLATDLVDADGQRVTVSGRFRLSSPPSRVRLSGWKQVVDWAGPWPADQRWWDDRQRRARVQCILDDGTAHLLVLEAGSWRLEATYD